MSQHSALFNSRRRWASSIAEEDLITEDDYDDYDDDYESSIESQEEDIVEEEMPSTNTLKKKKITKRQKRKQSLAGDLPLDVKFLHFQGLENDDSKAIQELEKSFDQLAFDNDLSKFKWISMLEKSLVLKVRQEEGEEEKRNSKKPKDDRVRDYWKVALKAANNKKKVPDGLKGHFLNRMVVGPSSRINSSSEDSVDAATIADEDQNDALLLARARELAIDHPLLWRRYSAKERKLRVRLSKKLLEERANEIISRNGESGSQDPLDPQEQAILSAVEDRSTSLEFYLQHVRIPALYRLHHEEKTVEKCEQEAIDLQQLLKQRLPEISYKKMIALVQTYVDCFGSSQGDSLSIDDDGESLVTLKNSPLTPAAPTDIEAMKEQQQKQKQKKQQQKRQKQFRVLLSNLRKVLPQGRIHWVGQDVADFFYVTKPDEVDPKEDNSIASDPILGHSEANWNETRDQYVQSFLNIQKLFLDLEREQDEQRRLVDDATTGSPLATTNLAKKDQLSDSNEDPSSEKGVRKTFDTVAALTRMDAKQSTTQRVKPRTYIPLEAMAIGDTWNNPSDAQLKNLIESQTRELQRPDELPADNSSTINGAPFIVFGNDDAFPLHPPADRLVIVDNLPIDITEFRLREAYGRCGEIQSIAIFHSRPDLDPGRRATDSAKKIRNPSSSSRRQKWTRPRTPLYAMILYKESAGAEKASCDPLRLFGMVLDQHLMRSHRASDMTTLYLEDVPCSIKNVSSMEFELGQILEASDLYVCLDDSAQHLNLRTKAGGDEKKRRKHQANQIFSYTIRFPSFEAAYWSYWKLSRELPLLETTNDPLSPSHLGGPTLHWMDTPRDSHLYWTRKLNF